MNRRTGFSLAPLAAILLLLSTLPSFAQDREDYDQDPPTRAGRVGYTQGSVSFQPAGNGDWVDAAPNRPLTTGDNLWADRDSRAEVQVGSTSIRLSSETSLTLLDLSGEVTQLRLSMGSLFLHVRHVGANDALEVDTPNLAFNVTEPGEYRIDVNENGDQTTATVWRGSADITGGGSTYRLIDGQQGVFYGTDQLRYDVGEIGRDDDFSRWCLDRDRRYEHIRSAQYVSPEVTGYEDLDEYGSWSYDSEYGNVWAPRNVAYDWAPYRYGHWVYISPWGWTWVDDARWGFAPFHYGRWAYRHGWFWVPGPVAVVPVYSPALVAFVGGGGFHVGVGFGGGVGWFPLGPGEVYVPWYRTSRRYVEHVNVTNTRVTVVNVTNVYNNVNVNHVNNVTYINQRVNNSVTVVNQQTFVNARPVRSNMIRVDARELQRAPVTHEFARNTQPDRQSVMGNSRPVRFAPPAPVMARPVMGTRQPMMVNRATPVQGTQTQRTYTPPPVRTVQAAPQNEVKPLERGARGTTPGFGNRPMGAPVNAGRPMPDNPRNATPYGGPAGSGQNPVNPVNRPAMNVPRPGVPQNGVPNNGVPNNGRGISQRDDNAQRTPQNLPANRPNVPVGPSDVQRNNAPVTQPSAPGVNRPVQDNNRPNPDNNRPGREAPRPTPARPDAPQMNTQPDQPRSNPTSSRPQQPDNGNASEPARTNHRMAPPDVLRDSAPVQTQQQAPPPQRQVRPEPAPRPQENQAPQVRREPTPSQREVRPEPAPRPQESQAPQVRREPTPPPQRESRQQQEKPKPSDNGHDKDKGPSKFR